MISRTDFDRIITNVLTAAMAAGGPFLAEAKHPNAKLLWESVAKDLEQTCERLENYWKLANV